MTLHATALQDGLPMPRPSWADSPTALHAAVQDQDRLQAVAASGLWPLRDDPAFDPVTRLACQLLQVPASFVTVVTGDGDRYPSHCGLPEPLASSRARAGLTYCHYVVAAGDSLAIDDTLAHLPWSAVPSAADLGVRAYMGVPLRWAGAVVGSLCVIDTRPRTWTTTERDTLDALAESLGRELSLRWQAAQARGVLAQLQDRALRREAQLLQAGQALRDPLQALTLCTLQLQRADGTAAGGVGRVLPRVQQALACMRSVTDGLLDELDNQPPETMADQPLPLADMLVTSLDMARPLADARQVVLQPPPHDVITRQALAGLCLRAADHAGWLRLLGRLHAMALRGTAAGGSVVVVAATPTVPPAGGQPAFRLEWQRSAVVDAQAEGDGQAPDTELERLQRAARLLSCTLTAPTPQGWTLASD